MPRTNPAIACAASSMSHKWARSRSAGFMQDQLVAQHGPTKKGIAQGILFDEIDLVPKDATQFVAHIGQIEKAPGSFRLEGDQHVDIAARRLLPPCHRAEQGELLNL